LALAAAPPTFEAVLVDGKTHAGAIVELTPDRLRLDASGGQVALETEGLLSLSVAVKPAAASERPGAAVELFDGSAVLGRRYSAQAGRSVLTLLDGAAVDVPTAAVRAVRFLPSSAPEASGDSKPNAGQAADRWPAPWPKDWPEDWRREWFRLTELKPANDLLVVYKGDGIDYLEGAILEVSDDAVRFELDGEALPVKRSKIHGLIYRRGPSADLPPAVCRIADASGSRWAVAAWKLDGPLRFTTPAGAKVACPLESIVQMDFSSGKLTYLSDLKPESTAWTPFFPTDKPLPAMERFYAPRSDRSFDAAGLRLGETAYDKGLAVYARTEIVYALPEAYRRFRAAAGLDAAAAPRASARLTIRGDGRTLFEAALARGDAPRAIDLDISGVKKMSVLVDFGDPPTPGDRLLLCNPKLSR